MNRTTIKLLCKKLPVQINFNGEPLVEGKEVQFKYAGNINPVFMTEQDEALLVHNLRALTIVPVGVTFKERTISQKVATILRESYLELADSKKGLVREGPGCTSKTVKIELDEFEMVLSLTYVMTSVEGDK